MWNRGVDRVITLLVITDGRGEYLTRTLDSATTCLSGPFEHRVMVDDSGQWRYTHWLQEQFPDFSIVGHGKKLGLAAAVRTGWASLPPDTEWVFHLEEDFEFVQPVNVPAIIDALRADIRIAQVVLKRQPWSAEEQRAGGIVELHPDDYTERFVASQKLSCHRRIFSLNPCVYNVRWARRGWPDGNEAGYSERIFQDPSVVCAFLGGKFDPPLVTHIGERRSQGWQL